MIIRPATGSDAGAVAALWNVMITQTLFTFTSQPKTGSEVEALIAGRAGQFWVADAEGVAGFITYGAFAAGWGIAMRWSIRSFLMPQRRARVLAVP